MGFGDVRVRVHGVVEPPTEFVETFGRLEDQLVLLDHTDPLVESGFLPGVLYLPVIEYTLKRGDTLTLQWRPGAPDAPLDPNGLGLPTHFCVNASPPLPFPNRLPYRSHRPMTAIQWMSGQGDGDDHGCQACQDQDD